MDALVGRGYIPTFEACKRDGTATFPGPPCWTPKQHKDDEPRYLGIGHNCTRTGRQCSAKTCPECTANTTAEGRCGAPYPPAAGSGRLIDGATH